MSKKKSRLAELLTKRTFWGMPYIATFNKDHLNTGTGILYLTAGGRMVIDCGWGEYFDKAYGDRAICTLDELRQGFKKEEFIKKLRRH